MGNILSDEKEDAKQTKKAEAFFGSFTPDPPSKCLGQPKSTVAVIELEPEMFDLSADYEVTYKGGEVAAVIEGTKKDSLMKDHMLLKGPSKQPVALLAEKKMSMDTYFIYGFKPYFSGQQPSAVEAGVDGKSVYAWAKMFTKKTKLSAIVKDEVHMCMATEADEYHKKPTYVGSEHVLRLNQKMSVRKDGQGCCIFEKEGVESGDEYTMRVAANIDPILMIAFAVIWDRMTKTTQLAVDAATMGL